jgi:hypothetical protein
VSLSTAALSRRKPAFAGISFGSSAVLLHQLQVTTTCFLFYLISRQAMQPCFIEVSILPSNPDKTIIKVADYGSIGAV